MIEQDYPFSCPYCGADMSVRLDVSGGRKQSFVHDCENCCSPIQIDVEFKGETIINFSASVQ